MDSAKTQELQGLLAKLVGNFGRTVKMIASHGLFPARQPEVATMLDRQPRIPLSPKTCASHPPVKRDGAKAGSADGAGSFRAAFEAAAVGMALLDAQGHWCEVNHQLCQLLGYDRQELLRRTYQDITHPEDLAADLTQARRLISGEISNYSLEKRYIRGDGSHVWARLTVAPVHDEGQAPARYIAVIDDISRRREAEEGLRQEKQFSERLIDTAQTIFLVLDREGNIVRINRHLEQLCGYRQSEVSGESWFDIFIPQRDRPRIRRIFAQASDGVPTQGNVNPVVTKDGRERLVQWFDAPLTDRHGRISHLLCVGHDITEQQATEEALRDSERRLRAIVNTASDAIVTHDERGIIDGFNPAAEQMFGYSAQEALGQNLKILMPSPYREEHDGYLQRYCRTGEKRVIGKVRELTASRKDGTEFPVELAVSEVVPRRLFTGIVRDISARKALERQVVEAISEERLRIGQDLHDSVGQELAGLRHLALTLFESLSEADLPEAKLARRIGEVAASAHHQVRALSRGLAPVSLDDEGLIFALADLTTTTSELHSIDCRFDCPSPIVVADLVQATHLYRIVQEAVANALRHGQATRILVSLREENNIVCLSVQDNGTGISSETVDSKGIGLKVAVYRAEQIGATLRVSDTEEGGVQVTCCFALPQEVEVP